MTATVRATASAVLALAIAGAAPARAQLQPPPFSAEDAAPRATAPAPVPRPTPPAAPPAPAKPEVRPSTPAPAVSDDDIDDPKVSRRLGKRINVPPPREPASPPSPPASRASAPSPASAPPRASAPPPPAPPPSQPVAPLPPAPLPVETETSTPTIARAYTPAAEGPFRPVPPRLKLAYRRFNFVRLGASTSPDGIAAPETFNSIGADVYPMSSLVRIGLTSTFGWQSGPGFIEGDYFATQSLSVGLQYRDLGRVIPFVEGFGGVGYMRRLQFERTVPTAFWQFGADAGAEIYVARTGYVSLAIGYLRPVNGFAMRQHFTSVFVDTWSFKLGIGI